MADAGAHPHQPVLFDAQRLGVFGVDPQRMPVRDLVQPLAARRAGVDQGRDAERRQQDALAPGQVQVLQWTWEGIHHGEA